LRAPACWTGVVWNYDRKNMHTLFSRLLPLPEELRGQAFNRAIIRCLDAAEHARLGHFLVVADGTPLPDLARGPQRRPRRFGAGAGPPVRRPGTANVDDPSASAGPFRRAGPEVAGPVVWGPYVPLSPGRYRLEFAVRGEGTVGPGPVGHVISTALRN